MSAGLLRAIGLGLPLLAALAGPARAGDIPPFDPAAWRRAFARPADTPSPADNSRTSAKVALGERLFGDPRLSGAGARSCSTCHQPALAFTDGLPRHAGLDGKPLARRTPPLWNLAWSRSYFWDGRAETLEAQARLPIEHAREMGGSLAVAAARLAADPEMAGAFADAFPDEGGVSEASVAAALAAFERTLVSPLTRFDRWVAGDEAALTQEERQGLELFVGKAGCVACHKGWRMTDDRFHDIGLRSPDRGRAEITGEPADAHAFKTPSLRERVWTAPFMHDGSLATFEYVVEHYLDRIEERPTLSRDLPRGAKLDEGERAALIAFLSTLSSEDPPRPLAEVLP